MKFHKFLHALSIRHLWFSSSVSYSRVHFCRFINSSILISSELNTILDICSDVNPFNALDGFSKSCIL